MSVFWSTKLSALCLLRWEENSETSSSRFVSSETPDVSASSRSMSSIDCGRGRFTCGESSVSESTECFLFRLMGVSGAHDSGGSVVESLPNVVEGGHSPSPSGGDGGNSACSKSRESGVEGFKLAARPLSSELRALRSSDRRNISRDGIMPFSLGARSDAQNATRQSRLA